MDKFELAEIAVLSVGWVVAALAAIAMVLYFVLTIIVLWRGIISLVTM